MDWDARSLSPWRGPVRDRRLVPPQRERQQLLCLLCVRAGPELFDSRPLHVRLSGV